MNKNQNIYEIPAENDLLQTLELMFLTLWKVLKVSDNSTHSKVICIEREMTFEKFIENDQRHEL